MKLLRFIWRKLVPARLRQYIFHIRCALNPSTSIKIIVKPTFADDGLISQHISDFMSDNKFLYAYSEGVKQGGLENHPGGIQFRVYVCCWAAQYASNLEGDFVEYGVGKGIISKAICVYLNFESATKTFYLFDTFQGIPLEDASSDKEKSNMAYLNELHFDTNYSEVVKNSFKDFPNVEVVIGKVPESLHGVNFNKISYISIDMNNAKAEISAIEFLWDKLVLGGIIVLDDYAYGEEFREQKNAWDKFAAKKQFKILTLPTGQGLIIKS